MFGVIQVISRYEISGYLFTLVRPLELKHAGAAMSILLLLVISAVFANGQPAAWESLSKLASQRFQADDFGAAELLRREALRLAEEKLGPEDKQLAGLLANLALSLHTMARDAEAEPLARRAFFIAEQSGDLRLTGMVLNTLGVVLAGEGEAARSEPVLRRSVGLLEQADGPDALNVARAANNLITLYADTRQYAKAEQEITRILPIYERALGPEHPDYALALSNMFTILYQQGRGVEGEPYLRRAIAIGEKVFPQSLNMANIDHCLAVFETTAGNYKEAARLFERIIAIQERLLGPGHPLLARTLVNYSSVLQHLHQKTEAKHAQNRANLILKSLR
jgi:tetratricopeptide (TPR) repeat protein